MIYNYSKHNKTAFENTISFFSSLTAFVIIVIIIII